MGEKWQLVLREVIAVGLRKWPYGSPESCDEASTAIVFECLLVVAVNDASCNRGAILLSTAGKMAAAPSRPFDYLEGLPGTVFYKLYQQPSTALAIFRRMLPDLGMCSELMAK